MQSPILSRISRGVFVALVAFVLMPLAAPQAQAQPSDAEREALMAQRAERTLERLTEELSLTTRQAGLVEQALAEGRDPGALWTLAADLTPTLSDAQKATLFAAPERPERAERLERSERAEGRERAGRRGSRAEGLDAADIEARDEALGLSNDQAAQLDALHEQRRAERQERVAQRRAERGERSARPAREQHADELAEVLTPAQQEIAKVHQALLMRMRPQGPRHGSRVGRRAGGPGQGR